MAKLTDKQKNVWMQVSHTLLEFGHPVVAAHILLCIRHGTGNYGFVRANGSDLDCSFNWMPTGKRAEFAEANRDMSVRGEVMTLLRQLRP
jgi:hypothetical protein